MALDSIKKGEVFFTVGPTRNVSRVIAAEDSTAPALYVREKEGGLLCSLARSSKDPIEVAAGLCQDLRREIASERQLLQILEADFVRLLGQCRAAGHNPIP